MRIAKNTTQLLSDAPSSRFLLVVDVMDGDVILEREGRTLLSLTLAEDGGAVARLCYPDGREGRLYGAHAKGQQVILTAGYARLGLYVGGVLLDEDFFFAPLDYKDATVHAGSFMHFEAGYEYHSMSESAIVENVTDALDGFRPTGTDYAVLRPIPAALNGTLHVLYLDERNGGTAKDGMGANKLCALFSHGGGFASAPIALPIDSVEEKRMVDAALLLFEGRYYLYYLVDYRACRALSCAVSEDGYSFLKTGLDIDIPDVDNATIDGIAVESGAAPALLFTAKGRAYRAESLDLLHFTAPERLTDFDGFERVLPLRMEEGVRLFAVKSGVLYEKTGDGVLPVAGAPENAQPVLWQGRLLLIGAENGKLCVSSQTRENGTMV